MQGLVLLSDWSSKVLQQSAWKYARPNNDPSIESVVCIYLVCCTRFKLPQRNLHCVVGYA